MQKQPFADVLHNSCSLGINFINSFVSNAPFLYPLETSENFSVFRCFQGVERGYIGNKWVKKETVALVFSSEFCKIFKNSFLIEYLRLTVFEAEFLAKNQKMKIRLKSESRECTVHYFQSVFPLYSLWTHRTWGFRMFSGVWKWKISSKWVKM